MQIRRSLALLSGALLLTTSLGSCGFDRATDRVNNIAQGTTDRDGTVDVLNAVVVSAEDGSGVLITTLVNNDLDVDASLDAVVPADPEAVQVGEFTPVSIDPAGMVNLAASDPVGIPLEGDVEAGAVISMTLQLSGGQTVDLDVPVVHNCYEYAGLDGEGGDCEVTEVEEH